MAQKADLWRSIFRLIHVYAGIFIAPFIFIAAITGFFYAITPQIEQWIYHDHLYVEKIHPHIQPLSQQLDAAHVQLSASAQITEVRPAPEPNQTTRVIFSDPQRHQYNQAIFIDPYTLKFKGQLAVYGTSGLLPFRTQLDHLHRDLLLGNWGRWYSELAVSWLGILVITGLYQWFRRRRIAKLEHNQRSLLIDRHSQIGLMLLPLLLFIAITGLTWSQWAGQNIGVARQWLNWQTPILTTTLQKSMPAEMQHHEHHMPDTALHTLPQVSTDFDQVLMLAQRHGIDSTYLQIKPPSALQQAWTVAEIQRRWPTEADSVAIDLQQHKIIDHLSFNDYPLIAKLTRWGVDAHIGILFGWVNQLILVLYSLGLCGMIIYAFRAWSKASSLKQTTSQLVQQTRGVWKQATPQQKAILCLTLSVLSLCLPLFGLSLILAIIMLWFQKKPQFT